MMSNNQKSPMATSSLHVNRDIILANKRQTLKMRQKRTPLEAVLSLAQMQTRPPGVLNYAVDDQEIKLIAQLTRTSVYDPVTSALHCVEAGADAISFFTDHAIYEQDLDDMLLVARGLPDVAILYQNYVLSEYAVMSARASGASGIVVYASLLQEETVRQIASMAQRWKMSVVVQLDDAEQIHNALSLSPHALAFGDHLSKRIQPTLDTLQSVRHLIPKHCRVMLTHVLASPDDVATVLRANVNALIVHQDLLKHEHSARQVRALLSDAQT